MKKSAMVTYAYKESSLIGWLIITDLAPFVYEQLIQISMSFPSIEHFQSGCLDCKLCGKYQNGGMGKAFLCHVFLSISDCWDMQPYAFPSLSVCPCAYWPRLLLLKSFSLPLAWLKCCTQNAGAVDKCTKRGG